MRLLPGGASLNTTLTHYSSFFWVLGRTVPFEPKPAWGRIHLPGSQEAMKSVWTQSSRTGPKSGRGAKEPVGSACH